VDDCEGGEVHQQLNQFRLLQVQADILRQQALDARKLAKPNPHVLPPLTTPTYTWTSGYYASDNTPYYMPSSYTKPVGAEQ